MTQLFFKRTEKKYLLNTLEYQLIVRDIHAHMQPDAHYQSHINNVYFDTPHDELVIASIAATDYKYKVRARNYGSDSRGTVFLEIKSKLEGTVYKRRVKLTDGQYLSYLASKEPQRDDQVMHEVDYLFRDKQLLPKLFIAYDRQSFAARDDSGLRITFDANLRSRQHDVLLEKTDECQPYFDEDTFIMEIKSPGGLPQWLTQSLSKHQIYPSSFSKYGKIYQKNHVERLAYA